MNFILTFLSYFLIGLIAGTLFSPQIRNVMDHGIVPLVHEGYSVVKEQILKSKGLKSNQIVSSTAEIQKKSKAIAIDSSGDEVYENENGELYGIDESGTIYYVLDSEIDHFYENY